MIAIPSPNYLNSCSLEELIECAFDAQRHVTLIVLDTKGEYSEADYQMAKQYKLDVKKKLCGRILTF